MIERLTKILEYFSSGPAPDLEHYPRGEPLPETEDKRFVSQVDVRVHQARHRLCDPDGASVKAVLDAIVASGLLRDDGPEEVREVRFTQEKIGTDEVEYTRITLKECD